MWSQTAVPPGNVWKRKVSGHPRSAEPGIGSGAEPLWLSNVQMIEETVHGQNWNFSGGYVGPCDSQWRWWGLEEQLGPFLPHPSDNSLLCSQLKPTLWPSIVEMMLGGDFAARIREKWSPKKQVEQLTPLPVSFFCHSSLFSTMVWVCHLTRQPPLQLFSFTLTCAKCTDVHTAYMHIQCLKHTHICLLLHILSYVHSYTITHTHPLTHTNAKYQRHRGHLLCFYFLLSWERGRQQNLFDVNC